MNNNTCQNCKHWERREDTKFGRCKKVIEIAYWDEWPELGFSTQKPKETPSQAIFGDNVWTAEDFGCINFESNEPK